MFFKLITPEYNYVILCNTVVIFACGQTKEANTISFTINSLWESRIYYIYILEFNTVNQLKPALHLYEKQNHRLLLHSQLSLLNSVLSIHQN